MNISIGVRRDLRNLPFTRSEIGRRIQRGLEVVGKAVLGGSQKIVPIDTKKLHDSGYSAILSGSSYSTIVQVGYGGPDAPYAVFVHEDQPKKHSPLRHGSTYNAYYGLQISAGLTHSRRPEEKAFFLSDTVTMGVINQIWKNIFVATVKL